MACDVEISSRCHAFTAFPTSPLNKQLWSRSRSRSRSRSLPKNVFFAAFYCFRSRLWVCQQSCCEIAISRMTYACSGLKINLFRWASQNMNLKHEYIGFFARSWAVNWRRSREALLIECLVKAANGDADYGANSTRGNPRFERNASQTTLFALFGLTSYDKERYAIVLGVNCILYE